MAKRKRRSSTRRRIARARVNPRRRRHTRRRRHNPGIVMRVAPRRHRRRHYSRRRRNPSAIRVGQALKDTIYGSIGAIGTRAVSALAQGFVPGAFSGFALSGPILQALIAATVIRWGGKKFLGPQQGELLMLGGFISAGLAAADILLPGGSSGAGLTNIFQRPIAAAPQAQLPGSVNAGTALSDVYDVDMNGAGFGGIPYGLGDVEDVTLDQFGNY